MPLLQKYKLNITWGDQDLLNIIFHYNPGLCNHIHNLILTTNVMFIQDTNKALLNMFFLLDNLPSNKHMRVCNNFLLNKHSYSQSFL